MTGQNDARRDVIERVAVQLNAWHLREPALLFLTMHAPLAFFGSQLLIAAQPLLGMFTGDGFARELAELIEDPQNIELLSARLASRVTPAPAKTEIGP